mgnify:CR=1 FL=1
MTKDITSTYSKTIIMLSSCFGAGNITKAPGTAGSIFGFFVYFLCKGLLMSTKITIAIAIVISGIWICRQASEILDSHDHPSIVWDEMASMYCLLLFVPNEITSWIIIFILFRLFDIWKPWPISWFDSKITGGLGIMVDDQVRGSVETSHESCFLLGPIQVATANPSPAFICPVDFLQGRSDGQAVETDIIAL